MSRSEVGYCLVCYNNHDEVRDFISHVRERAVAVESEPLIAVCDNSERAEPRAMPIEWPAGTLNAFRPDNPGYLDGCRHGLNLVRSATVELPDWIVFTNTDLRFVGPASVQDLSDRHDPDTPVVIAPRITEGVERREKNPHLLVSRSPTRHRFNRLLTQTTAGALAYLVASSVRSERSDGSPCSDGDRSSTLPGTEMYAPYGAMMIFSRGFFRLCELPGGVPLLAEEIAVAEAARAHNIPVIYDPDIHVHHSPHSTTGASVGLGRARMLRRAFTFLDLMFQGK